MNIHDIYHKRYPHFKLNIRIAICTVAALHWLITINDNISPTDQYFAILFVGFCWGIIWGSALMRWAVLKEIENIEAENAQKQAKFRQEPKNDS